MNELHHVLRHFKGVIDSTLREGYQFTRADFTPADHKRIFSFLSRIGVDYVEVGNPVQDEMRRRICETAKDRNGGPVKILSHIRNNRGDLERALECRIDGVNILCTADRERLQAMTLTPEDYRARLQDNIRTALREGLEVRVSVEDFFNQPLEESLRIYALGERLGVHRIGLADTLGKALSWDIFRRIRFLRGRFRSDIEVHFHNDLGHAVSNAVVALSAGANWVDTSLLGIGERTGITPLSSFLLNMYLISPEAVERYDLKLLTEAENFVSRICRMEMPMHLLTNKRNGFSHKAGIHLQAIVKFGPQKYEPLSPRLIGNNRNLITGSLVSGKTAKEEAIDARRK